MQTQPALFQPVTEIVNVSSVPNRSPFRYPGGKTWLVPRIREWLARKTERPTELIEPFAGGAIVGLTAAFEKLVEHVTLVELDAQVASVWQTILYGDANWLIEQVMTFDVNPDTVDKLLCQEPSSLEERAFQTIVKNRTNHGGIMAPGSGRIKHGEYGKGIRSRWYPETIAGRIAQITTIKDRISFIEGDGLTVLRQFASFDRAVFFIDPPYTAGGKRAGRRLYAHNELNHEELFEITETLQGDFLMTYDDAPELHGLAAQHHFDTETIAMKNTHHAKMTELLIGRDLAWVRKPTLD